MNTRSCQEIARRALALFGVLGIALRSPRDDVIEWLRDEGLWDELSPTELAFVTAQDPTEKQIIDASWSSEALIVLIWALRKTEGLPAPDKQCDTAIFQELLPPFADMSATEFIQSAQCRPEVELKAEAEGIKRLHGVARHPPSRVQGVSQPYDIEIIQERHRAINWIVGYQRLSWDEVTTDT